MHQPVVRASTATAAAKKQVAAFTAVQENIQEKELHLEASESYLAVRLSCDLGGGGVSAASGWRCQQCMTSTAAAGIQVLEQQLPKLTCFAEVVTVPQRSRAIHLPAPMHSCRWAAKQPPSFLHCRALSWGLSHHTTAPGHRHLVAPLCCVPCRPALCRAVLCCNCLPYHSTPCL